MRNPGSIAVLLLALATSCAVTQGEDRVGHNAVELNRAQESSHNQILLLNVLRASKYLPQHWSALTTLRNSDSVELASGALQIPFGGAANDAYSISPSAKWTTVPSMEMAVLVSAEFTRGILQPISREQLSFFLNQGWPAEFVFHLSVGEIRETVETRVPGRGDEPDTWKVAEVNTLRNRPDRETDFANYNAFVAALDRLLARRLRVEEGTSASTSLAVKVSTGSELLALHAAGAKLSPVGEGLTRVELSRAPVLVLRIDETDGVAGDGAVGDGAVGDGAVGDGAAGDGAAGDGTGGDGKGDGSVRSVKSDDGSFESRPDGGGGAVPFQESFTFMFDDTRRTYSIVLRSPQELVYFLGQVVRAQRVDGGFTPTYKVGTWTDASNGAATGSVSGANEPVEFVLFRTHRDLGADESAVAVEFDGEVYALRETDPDGRDRSLMTFTFASLLIDLNRSRKDLPTTSVVAVSTP